MVLHKFQIEEALKQENDEIRSGALREENPLDESDGFRSLCSAVRSGDLKVCHEKIAGGVNINAKDRFDNTPLILASLCGQFEVVQLLLESGALCERDTFQGERCLYNALTDKIRNLLLQYDYSKSTNPLQPWAAHITSLLTRDHPKTHDLILQSDQGNLQVHKFLLSSRSSYFAKKLIQAPATTSFRLPNSIPIESIESVIKFLHLDEISRDLGDDTSEQLVLDGIGKLSQYMEVDRIFDFALKRLNRRTIRQWMADELDRAQIEISQWVEANIFPHKTSVKSDQVHNLKWDRQNAIFADILLECEESYDHDQSTFQSQESFTSIPIGPYEPSQSKNAMNSKSVIYPAHKSMLIRSEYFLTMFSHNFKEAQNTEHLQIVKVPFPPEVLEIILRFLYFEKVDIPLDIAIDVMFAADLFFLEKLKLKAATTISSLANVHNNSNGRNKDNTNTNMDTDIDIYEIIRAAWAVRVQRLEEFGARYLADRLEDFIDEPEFAHIVQESAERVQHRQATDTIELIDDIRYYLSERFKMRFEDLGIDSDQEELFEDEITNESLQGAGTVRTLDGEFVSDEFEEDAKNYQILLGKIDTLLENLKLDA